MVRGGVWWVEGHSDNQNLSLHGCSKHHELRIQNCRNCVVHVKGLVRSVHVVECQRTAVVLSGSVGDVEVRRSTRTWLYLTQPSPRVVAERCDQLDVDVADGCADVVLVTALCSAVNVCLPAETSGLKKELAVPDQFQSSFSPNRTLITRPLLHS